MKIPFENLMPSREKPETSQEVKLEGEAEKEFIENAYKSGRAGFYTYIRDMRLINLSGASEFAWVGFGDDKKGLSRKAMFYAQEINQNMQLPKGVNPKEESAYLKIELLTEQKPIIKQRKKVVVEKTGFFKKTTREVTEEHQDGTKTVPLPMSQFTLIDQDTEPAAKISYMHSFQGEPSWAQGHQNRGRIKFSAALLLPQKLAEEIVAKTDQDPDLLREILRKYSPKAWEYMEANGQFPMDKKINILADTPDHEN